MIAESVNNNQKLKVLSTRVLLE